MVLQVKIQLKGVTKPPVWRKLLIPGQLSFHQFHQVIQSAFGWQDYHLYQFSPKGFGDYPQICLLDEDWPEENQEDSQKTQIQSYLNQKAQTFTYLYDFGDNWMHEIKIEEIIDQRRIVPELIEGKGACPPEDCGGVWGYEDLKKSLSDSTHPEHRIRREWLGLGRGMIWDPVYFDLQEAQAEVAQSI